MPFLACSFSPSCGFAWRVGALVRVCVLCVCVCLFGWLVGWLLFGSLVCWCFGVGFGVALFAWWVVFVFLVEFSMF